jgi:hypothetical protein
MPSSKPAVRAGHFVQRVLSVGSGIEPSPHGMHSAAPSGRYLPARRPRQPPPHAVVGARRARLL